MIFLWIEVRSVHSVTAIFHQHPIAYAATLPLHQMKNDLGHNHWVLQRACAQHNPNHGELPAIFERNIQYQLEPVYLTTHKAWRHKR